MTEPETTELIRHLSTQRLERVPVRVTVEMGRTTAKLQDALNMEPGVVVSLDHDADDPFDIYVDGMLFGTGRLTTVNGDWAVEVLSVPAALLTGELDAA